MSLLVQKDDEFIAGRIRWRATKNGLPSGDTFEYRDAPFGVKHSIDLVLRERDIGIPVLVFGSQSKKWTVVGTRAAISCFDDETQHVDYSLIERFYVDRPVDKCEIEYLRIKTNSRTSIEFWGPRGGEFFAMWGILLGMARMHSPNFE